jgi:hypothetical protein
MSRRWAVRSVVLGLGATATMDAGADVVRRTTAVEPLDYRPLARWDRAHGHGAVHSREHRRRGPGLR